MLFQTSMTYMTSMEQTKIDIFTNVSAILVQTMIVKGVQNNLDPIDFCCIDEKTCSVFHTHKKKFGAT